MTLQDYIRQRQGALRQSRVVSGLRGIIFENKTPCRDTIPCLVLYSVKQANTDLLAFIYRKRGIDVVSIGIIFFRATGCRKISGVSLSQILSFSSDKQSVAVSYILNTRVQH